MSITARRRLGQLISFGCSIGFGRSTNIYCVFPACPGCSICLDQLISSAAPLASANLSLPTPAPAPAAQSAADFNIKWTYKVPNSEFDIDGSTDYTVTDAKNAIHAHFPLILDFHLFRQALDLTYGVEVDPTLL